jgi:holo-[acyl-carrier protein] synthase
MPSGCPGSGAGEVIVGVGSGLESVDELRQALVDEPGLRDRLFTPAEIAYCESKRYPEVHFAARKAAKVAAFHALQMKEDAWLEIQTRNSADGCPNLEMFDSVMQAASRAGVGRALLSLTHTRDHAAAFVVLES